MCTLIKAADQKLLDLAGSLFQTIAKTQEILERCSRYRKVPRLGDEPKAENQQEKLVEAEGLGPESSK